MSTTTTNNNDKETTIDNENNNFEMKKGFGWIPDLPDHRDFFYSTEKPISLEQLPDKVDLRDEKEMQFSIFDQGCLGSCTANAISAAIEYCQLKQNCKPFTPSRLFIYYNERNMEGTVNSDAGAQIRDGIKSMNSIGACSEDTWPYITGKFAQHPYDIAYKEALQHEVLQYRRIDNTRIEDLKACLGIDKCPFVFGIAVYRSFLSSDVARTGIVPMPSVDERMVGGHALLCVGYDDDTRRFIVRNSWGDKWGNFGYCYIPYDYLTNDNLADDFWIITLTEEEDVLPSSSSSVVVGGTSATTTSETAKQKQYQVENDL